MHITVQVRPDVATALTRPQASSPETQQLLSMAKELGVTLEPLHPGTRDPTLATYFHVTVPDAATAERVLARLRQSATVESAYLKPADALP
jgi:hypothetical protein